jgi:hypothetical protein
VIDLRVFVALVSSSLVACGSGGSPAQPTGPGNTSFTADAEADATLDGSADEGVDGGALDAGATDANVPDGQCPAVFPPTCQAGQTCMAACNVCTCEPDGGGLWACTTLGCPVGDP